MSKAKGVIYLAAFLIVINVVLLGFSYLKPMHKKPLKPEGPKNIIIKKLNFNDAQITKYEVLIKEHRESVRDKEQEIRKIKKELLNSVLNEALANDSLLSEIGKKQIKIEEIHLNHFKQIKNLCEPDQMEPFENLIQEMGHIFEKKRGKPRHKKQH